MNMPSERRNDCATNKKRKTGELPWDDESYRPLVTFENLPMAVDSLERFQRELVSSSDLALRWAASAAHDALYKLAIDNLEGSTPVRVLSKGVTAEGVPDFQEARIVDFERALKLTRDQDHMLLYCESKILNVDENEFQLLLSFHRDLRNDLEHFVPRISVRVAAEFFTYFEAVHKASYQLAFETGNASWSIVEGSASLRLRAQQALQSIRWYLDSRKQRHAKRERTLDPAPCID